ncbi:MAG: hypothetical protein N2Z71_08830 [Caloramator sp.]|nr:hypothetical protein [Caloramator sp.]
MKIFKNKFIILSIMTIMLLLTVGCRGTQYQRSLYDDDKKIASEGDSYMYGLRSGVTANNRTNIKFGSFTGMETIYFIEANNNSKIKIEFSSSVKKGNFKVVLVDPSNNITKILEGTQKGSIEIDVIKGRNRIKLVGRDAGGEVRLSLYPADDVEITSKSE